MSLITQSCNALMPGGRATAMQAVAVRMFRDSMLFLIEGVHTFLKGIAEDMNLELIREDALHNMEIQYGITPAPSDSLDDRRAALEVAMAITGNCGPGYIELMLQRAGFDVVIRENLPVVDLAVGDEVMFADYVGSYSFSDQIEPVFGQGNDGYLLGNGRLLQDDQTRIDPMQEPTSAGGGGEYFADYVGANTFSTDANGPEFGAEAGDWGFVFVIEAADGGLASVPSQKRDQLETLVLRLKPAHLGVYMRVQYV